MDERHSAINGPADAQPIVFLHGASLNRRMWDPQVEALSARYRTISVDLAGHGSRQGERFNIETAVREIGSLLESLDQPAVLVGFSLGAYVAMGVAARRPDLVRGLVVVGATTTFRGFGGIVMRAMGVLIGLAERPFEQRAIESMQRSVPPHIARGVIEGGFSMGAGARALWHVPGMRPRKLLSRYPGTVLLVNGERDKPNRAEEKRAVRACHEGILRTIPDAGHACSLSRPDDFTNELQGFLRTI